ncbi:MAG: MXAN_5187 C-terminal domain-containing protein [Polyangiaceae bacterium]
MDSSQIEHELEDLEGRLERLRSLYEQYFLGMEKVEPMVLRKDVDRRLWVLRREQIRNTGLRFKFQMLIQRYNTYQQYWTRVVREIENGTYRRDVIKVAQRFGEKAAITIAGKRRAEQYKRLAQNQLDRRKRRNAAQTDAEAEAADAAATRPSMPEITVEEEEAISLSGADIELIEDDSDLSSAPLRAVPPVRPAPIAAHAASEMVTGPEPDIEALLQLATVGVTTWSRPEPPRTESSPPARPAPRAKSPPSERPAPRSKRPSTKPPPRSRPSTKPPPRAKSLPRPGARPRRARLAPPRNRVAELAAQMRAKKSPRHQARRARSRSPPRPPTRPAPTRPIAPATATPTKPVVPAAATPTKPFVPPAPKPPSAPTPAKPRVPSAPPPPQGRRAHPPPPPPRSRAPLPLAARPPTPIAPRAPAAPPPARSEDLSDQKVREIYAKYVGAKRAANESTAGLTFDKLATSLRAQADKLKTAHPTRKIEFEVVTKDGKTALRPIVK